MAVQSRLLLLTSNLEKGDSLLMKKIITLIILAMFAALIVPAQDASQPNTPDAAKAISKVLVERLQARLMSAHIVIDNGRLTSFQLHPAVYVKLLQSVDTSSCPEDFRLAWLDYIQVWQRKMDVKIMAVNLADGISLFQGNLGAISDIAKRNEANDTLISWQKCERVALQYGVDSSRIRLH